MKANVAVEMGGEADHAVARLSLLWELPFSETAAQEAVHFARKPLKLLVGVTGLEPVTR